MGSACLDLDICQVQSGVHVPTGGHHMEIFLYVGFFDVTRSIANFRTLHDFTWALENIDWRGLCYVVICLSVDLFTEMHPPPCKYRLGAYLVLSDHQFSSFRPVDRFSNTFSSAEMISLVPLSPFLSSQTTEVCSSIDPIQYDIGGICVEIQTLQKKTPMHLDYHVLARAQT